MFLKKIEPNETVRFRVPGHVAQEFKKVRAESELLGWKFELNEEVARLILKSCKQALTEIDAEKKRREKNGKESKKDSPVPEVKQYPLSLS